MLEETHRKLVEAHKLLQKDHVTLTSENKTNNAADDYIKYQLGFFKKKFK
jgi:hypothetical protein